MHAREFLRRRGRLHLEAEILPFDAALEDRQLLAQLRAEMAHDFFHHVALGRRRKAGDGRHERPLLVGQFADETGRVQVVRAGSRGPISTSSAPRRTPSSRSPAA